MNKLFPDLEFGSKEYCVKEEEYLDWLFKNGILKESNQGNFYETAWIGPNDMNLAQRLIAGGPEHRKFLRQILVSVDITAPLYWWKEFDTYKIGTTANSTSTMHKLASTPITMECFETDDMDKSLRYNSGILAGDNISTPCNEARGFIINYCEQLRLYYLKTQDVRYWKELVRWLPEGWLQTRTVTMNYENVRTICHQRNGHKLTEWASFIKWAHTLPYAEELIFYKNCQ